MSSRLFMIIANKKVDACSSECIFLIKTCRFLFFIIRWRCLAAINFLHRLRRVNFRPPAYRFPNPFYFLFVIIDSDNDGLDRIADLFLKHNPPVLDKLPAFARASFTIEVEAFWEEAKLACQLGEEHYYPALCQAAKMWDRQAFRKALYDLLTANPSSEEEKKLYPYWEKMIQ